MLHASVARIYIISCIQLGKCTHTGRYKYVYVYLVVGFGWIRLAS